MADPFDPLPDLPAQPETAQDVAAQQHAAEWAKAFEPSTAQYARTPTSLALRARHRADIEEYANTVEQQRMAAEQHRLETDRNAANYALRARAMDMKAKVDQFNMGLQQRKLADAEAALPDIQAARAARAAADTSRVQRDAAIAKREADIETAANNFHRDLADVTALPDSPEYDAAILGLSQKYRLSQLDKTVQPLIKTATVNTAARTKAAVTEAQRAATEERAKSLGLPPSGITETGATTYHVPAAAGQSSPDASLIRTLDRTILKKEQEWRDAKAADPNAVPASEADLLQLRKQRADAAARMQGGAPQGTSAPTVPATPGTATSPQAPVIQKWGRDKDGNPVPL